MFQPKRRGRPTKEMVAERERLTLERAKPVMTDEEVLADIKSRFKMMDELTKACGRGDITAMVIPGAPGVGKSYTVTRALEGADVKFVRVTGGISAVELYALAYKYRAKGQIIVLDDSDSILKDEEGVNLLKALTDSSKSRTVSWRKQNASLASDEVPDWYYYRGSIILISNLDFQAIVDDGKSKAAVHVAALMSRSLYLETAVHDRRSLDLWIRHIAVEGKMLRVEGIDDEKLGESLLVWMSTNRDKLREYSLRTLHHLCTLVKMGGGWKEAARLTLCR